MKKIIFFILLTNIVSAQIKIGDITVGDNVAKEYFLSLAKYPDTLKQDFGCSIQSEEAFEEKIKSYTVLNRWTVRDKANCPFKYCTVMRKPNATEFAKWYIEYKKYHTKVTAKN